MGHSDYNALRRLLAGAVFALVIASTTPGAAQPAQETPVPTMTVVAQTGEVDADGRFQVFLDIAGAPANSDVAVDIYKPIRSAEELLVSASDELTNSQATFEPIPLADEAMAHQTTGFTILLYPPNTRSPAGSVGNWPHQLDEAGVYPIKVRLRDADDGLLKSFVTYLVRRPSPTDTSPEPITQAKVALLTTVHQTPVLGDDGADKPLDPGFTAALDGVLAQFKSRPNLPATLDVTPETADRLSRDPAATDTLASMTEALGRKGWQLLDAPFVELDPAQLVDNDLATELTRQAELGRRTLDQALGRPLSNTWVIDHPVDASTVEALGAIGVSHLVLPVSATSNGQPALPAALPGAAGGIDVITAGTFGLDAGAAADPVLAAHQLLGRMAASASLNPAGSAIIIRIDPETVDTVNMETLFAGLDEPGEYLQLTTLGTLFDDLPAADTPASLTPPSSSGLGTYPALVRETHSLLASYKSMLIGGAEQVQAYERPLAVTASADLSLPTRRRLLRRQQARLGATLASVTTPVRDRVTLGARDASFPLPITSTLGQPAKVLITLEASDRLSLPSEPIEATLSNARTIVQIPVRTQATGDTPLSITVRTPDGRILAQSRYRVRSTAVSGMGVLLTIGAGGFLALWWGRHWTRTRRRGRPEPNP